jgi:ribonuclease P protein component
VVSKAVGGSVLRHRTSRRLRALLLPRLGGLPAGTRLVVRAAPGAGSVPSRALAEDLDDALSTAVRPRSRR